MKREVVSFIIREQAEPSRLHFMAVRCLVTSSVIKTYASMYAALISVMHFHNDSPQMSRKYGK